MMRVLLVGLFLAALPVSVKGQQPRFDLVLTGGRVIDPAVSDSVVAGLGNDLKISSLTLLGVNLEFAGSKVTSAARRPCHGVLSHCCCVIYV